MHPEGQDIAGVFCEKCKTEFPFKELHTAFYVSEYGTPKGIYCSNCAVTPEERALSAKEIESLMTQLAPHPVSGAFKPREDSAYTGPEAMASFWLGIAASILNTFAVWHGKVLKFSIGSPRYRGLWIKPTWTGSRVTELLMAGDSPSKGIELNVYQTTRLAQLGFIEEGDRDKTWRIALEPHEQGVSNVTSILVHVLRFGYLFEATDVNSFTPTLDMNLDMPEYQHLRPKKKKK